MLRIVLDKCDSSYLSYDDIEKLINIDKNKDYYTNCTCFFNFNYMDVFGDVILQRENEYVSARELLDETFDGYTQRAIRREHNIEKIFRANGFEFRKGVIK